MNTFALTCLVVTAFATSALAAPSPPPPPPQPPPPPSPPTCFELSVDGKAWSKTPERMCIVLADKAATITLTTGMPPNPTQVAVFRLDLTSRMRCADCNQDVFSVGNPTNSVFNTLQVRFAGKRDVQAGTEHGTVTIGATKLHYRH